MNDKHLRRAIELSEEAARHGNRPFGAVLVAEDGTVLAEGRNEVVSASDVTAHAELQAIRAASVPTEGSIMYASGEPCPMCSAAMVWAGIERIVFAASEPEFSKVLEGGPRFALRCAEVVGSADVALTVEGPALEDEALAVMRYQTSRVSGA